MGRGLSDLQKRILMLFYERRQVRAQEERDLWELQWRWKLKGYSTEPYRVLCDMWHPEIIAALYDWPVQENYGVSRVRVNGQNFNPAAIGHDEYNRKTAAYYRAVSRLKQRGLLTYCIANYRGLWITDEGMRVAEELSVSRRRSS